MLPEENASSGVAKHHLHPIFQRSSAVLREIIVDGVQKNTKKFCCLCRGVSTPFLKPSGRSGVTPAEKTSNSPGTVLGLQGTQIPQRGRGGRLIPVDASALLRGRRHTRACWLLGPEAELWECLRCDGGAWAWERQPTELPMKVRKIIYARPRLMLCGFACRRGERNPTRHTAPCKGHATSGNVNTGE